MLMFERYAGIEYSGSGKPDRSTTFVNALARFLRIQKRLEREDLSA